MDVLYSDTEFPSSIYPTGIYVWYLNVKYKSMILSDGRLIFEYKIFFSEVITLRDCEMSAVWSLTFSK